MTNQTVFTHLPDHLHDDVRGGESKARMVNGVVRLTDSSGCTWYYYRKNEITHYEGASSNSYGRWRACGISCDTMQEARRVVDSHMVCRCREPGHYTDHRVTPGYFLPHHGSRFGTVREEVSTDPRSGSKMVRIAWDDGGESVWHTNDIEVLHG